MHSRAWAVSSTQRWQINYGQSHKIMIESEKKEIILSMECKQCDVRYKPCAKANNVLCCFECEYYWVCVDKCDGPKETDEE